MTHRIEIKRKWSFCFFFLMKNFAKDFNWPGRMPKITNSTRQQHKHWDSNTITKTHNRCTHVCGGFKIKKQMKYKNWKQQQEHNTDFAKLANFRFWKGNPLLTNKQKQLEKYFIKKNQQLFSKNTTVNKIEKENEKKGQGNVECGMHRQKGGLKN